VDFSHRYARTLNASGAARDRASRRAHAGR